MMAVRLHYRVPEDLGFWLEAECIARNSKLYLFIFIFIFISFDDGKRWGELTTSEASKLIELAFQEIGVDLPPLIGGSTEREWSKADAKITYAVKQSMVSFILFNLFSLCHSSFSCTRWGGASNKAEA